MSPSSEITKDLTSVQSKENSGIDSARRILKVRNILPCNSKALTALQLQDSDSNLISDSKFKAPIQPSENKNTPVDFKIFNKGRRRDEILMLHEENVEAWLGKKLKIVLERVDEKVEAHSNDVGQNQPSIQCCYSCDHISASYSVNDKDIASTTIKIESDYLSEQYEDSAAMPESESEILGTVTDLKDAGGDIQESRNFRDSLMNVKQERHWDEQWAAVSEKGQNMTRLDPKRNASSPMMPHLEQGTIVDGLIKSENSLLSGVNFEEVCEFKQEIIPDDLHLISVDENLECRETLYSSVSVKDERGMKSEQDDFDVGSISECELDIKNDNESASFEALQNSLMYSEEKPVSLEGELISCSLCSAKFVKEDCLGKHLMTHSETGLISCAYCPRKFLTKSAAVNHSKVHFKKPKFTCSECFAELHSRYELKKHSMTHSMDQVFPCTSCPAKFSSERRLKTHLSAEHKQKSFSCPKCPSKFLSNGELKRHFSSHSMIRPFSCSTCTSKFKRKTALHDHQVVHLKEKPISCSHCPLKFRRKSEVLLHLRKHGFNELKETQKRLKKSFSCPRCPAKFSVKAYLRNHLVIHSEERPFSCPSCPLKFKTRAILYNHRVLHFEEKPFSCAHCPSKFTTKRAVWNHLKKHGFEAASTYYCEYCPKTFVAKTDAEEHKRVHLGEKPFTCAKCGKKYHSKQGLTIHLRIYAEHNTGKKLPTPRKSFACKLCPKAYTQSHSLFEHMRLHTGDRPYSCVHCSAKFYKKSILDSHVQMHTGEKPFSCTFCVKKFMKKGTLQTHIRSHTGEKLAKPHSCPQCAAKFRSRGCLEIHARIHNQEQPFACDICQRKFSQRGNRDAHVRNVHDVKHYACPLCPAKFSNVRTQKDHIVGHDGFKCSLCPEKFNSNLSLMEHLRTHSKKKNKLKTVRYTK